MFVRDPGYGPEIEISSRTPVGYSNDEFGERFVTLFMSGSTTGDFPLDEIFVVCEDCGRSLLGRQIMKRDADRFEFLADLCDDCVGYSLPDDKALVWVEGMNATIPDYVLWGLRQDAAISKGRS